MITPIEQDRNKKRSRIIYITVGAIIYLIFCDCYLHYSALRFENKRMSFSEAVNRALTDILIHPFHVRITSGGLLFLFICLMLTGIMIFLLKDSIMLRKHDPSDTVQGTAKLMDEKDLRAYNLKYSSPLGEKENDGFNNIILSQDIRLAIDNRGTKRNCNIIVIGGSGTGKSRFFVGPNILQNNSNYVITDPSGDLLSDYGKQLENDGYKVSVFNLVDVYKSNQYNPFKYIHAEKDVFILVETFIKNTTPPDNKGGDQFWESSEKLLLNALILYIWHMFPKEQQTFAAVLDLLKEAEINENDDTSQPNPLDERFEELRRLDKDNLALKQYDTFKLGGAKTLKSILISVGVRMKAFGLSDVAYLTERDTFDLETFADKKQAIFVILPTADKTFNFLVALFYTQIFATLYNYGETRSRYGWKIIDINKVAIITEQAYNNEESEIAKAQIDAIYNCIKTGRAGIEIRKNKKRNYWEVYTNKYVRELKVIGNKTNRPEVFYLKDKDAVKRFNKITKDYSKDDTIFNEINEYIERSNREINDDSIKRTCLDKIKEMFNVASIPAAEEYMQIVRMSVKAHYNIEKTPEGYKIMLKELIGWKGGKNEVKEFIKSFSMFKVERCRKLACPNHVRFLLDEFANIGQIPDFNEKLATMRKYEISCSIILQARTQLKDLYKDNMETIIGNCDTALFLGSVDMDTIKWLMERLGKKTTTIENVSIQNNKQGSTSLNKGSIELLTADQIALMQDNECLVYVRGVRPYYGKKFDIENHPNYKKAQETEGTFVIEASKTGTIISNIPVWMRNKDQFAAIADSAKNVNAIEKINAFTKNSSTSLAVTTSNEETTDQSKKIKTSQAKKNAEAAANGLKDFDSKISEKELSQEVLDDIFENLNNRESNTSIKDVMESIFIEESATIDINNTKMLKMA